jgi:hypothetical protein
MRPASALALKVLSATGIGTLAIFGAGGALAGASLNGDDGPDSGQHASEPFQVSQILAGASLQHTFTPTGSTTPQTETLSKPDDITRLRDKLFVGFQNGVGPQGQPSPDGNLDSTVVELGLNGHVIAQWDVAGKTDGLTADPELGGVIATVNEDANSALFTIRTDGTPPAAAVTSYTYSQVLPHLGGTDAIAVDEGQIFVSASAPGTNGAPAPQPTYPAVYTVTLDPTTQVATVHPLFNDEDPATVANVNSSQWGKPMPLALTDPDSNAIVPQDASRFAGDFMLTSQADQQQIYVDNAGESHQWLAVLSMSQAVDDTAWPNGHSGALYSTDSTNDAVDVVTGPFHPGQPVVVATPCGSNSAPSVCPAPPSFPANYLATLNPWTGQVTAVTIQGAPYVPQGGLVFAPRDSDSDSE